MGAKTATTRTATARTAKAAPATKRAAPAKKAAPPARKTATAVNKAASAKKPAPAKKIASAKKTVPAKKNAPVTKNAAPAKKAAPAAKRVEFAPAAKRVAPVNGVQAKAAFAAPASRAAARVLTEAEILRAPEKDYMNASQLLFFKSRLQGMEQDILRNAGETTEHLRESIIVPDPADRATIEEEHALELRTRDRERKLLKKIQQSIYRIDSGEYGYCEETGDPIGVPRLLARPTATLSLEAQERREMKQRMFGE